MDVFAEKFADIKILRYSVPEFEKLTLDQKIYIYYLSQAALCGRDILWDQNNRYNLAIREILETIFKSFKGNRETPEISAIRDLPEKGLVFKTESIIIIQPKKYQLVFLRLISMIFWFNPIGLALYHLLKKVSKRSFRKLKRSFLIRKQKASG